MGNRGKHSIKCARIYTDTVMFTISNSKLYNVSSESIETCTRLMQSNICSKRLKTWKRCEFSLLKERHVLKLFIILLRTLSGNGVRFPKCSYISADNVVARYWKVNIKENLIIRNISLIYALNNMPVLMDEGLLRRT